MFHKREFVQLSAESDKKTCCVEVSEKKRGYLIEKNMETELKIGIAMPCFNNLDVLKESIPALFDSSYLFVLFDDGSTDGSKEWVEDHYPDIHVLQGNSENWWTGSLAKAIDFCMNNGCDYIVSVNADVLISPAIVKQLIYTSRNESNAIVASLVVDVNNPRKIVWAGSKFGRVHPLFPVYASKYLFKPGSLVTDISKSPYEVDEVHGRGVLIPRVVIEKVGNYDSISFPHYGGDNDFSLRAKKNGVRMFINPRCRAKVYACNTSLNVQLGKSLKNKVIGLKNYLFLRKHGEALFVWWKLYKRHLPPVYFLQSYISVIVFNLLKKMRK